ncbi:hypothetical protein AX17_000579 [Amanita inopinata Kibby_2008]|nr:hypothetical protein AX17_000579 [Amanita inopinata Kibby_2008]
MSAARPTQPSIASTARAKPFQQPLSKRLLFPSLPPDAPFPPLLSSPSVSPELAAEVYDFIAFALRAYVNPWWSKISRYDKELMPEINRIVVHIIKVFETRLQMTDIPVLVLRDIPVILAQHYRDYRNAASKLSTSYANSGSSSLPLLFHQLQPHMAISPDGKINEEYYRQVIDHLLRICLPLEDYAPEAERCITREIILKVFLTDILPRVTQPWFIQLAILNLLDSESGQTGTYIRSSASSSSSSSISSHNILIVLLSTVQKLSGACLTIVHAYRQAVNAIKLVNRFPHTREQSSASSRTPAQEPSYANIPSDISVIPRDSEITSGSLSSTDSSYSTSRSQPSKKALHAKISMRRSSFSASPRSASLLPLLTLLSEIFSTADRFASLIFTTTISITVVSFISFFDRLVPHLLMSSLSSGFALNLMRLAKRNLFPNGYPGPTYSDPTVEEQVELRARLTAYRPGGILAYLAPVVLGPDPTATLDHAIEPLCDAACNVHLAILLVDKFLMGLFPELADAGWKSQVSCNDTC